MRILYVAFTRAKEKLIITGATSNIRKALKNGLIQHALDTKYNISSEVFKGKSLFRLDWHGIMSA